MCSHEKNGSSGVVEDGQIWRKPSGNPASGTHVSSIVPAPYWLMMMEQELGDEELPEDSESRKYPKTISSQV
jgi:hypothetical protein